MMTPVAPFLASYPGLIHSSLDQIHHGFCHPADVVYLQADMEVSSFVLVGTTSAWAYEDLPGSLKRSWRMDAWETNLSLYSFLGIRTSMFRG